MSNQLKLIFMPKYKPILHPMSFFQDVHNTFNQNEISITKLHIDTNKHAYMKYNTWRVCRRSLMVFNGSDIAARTTEVWRSSNIEAPKMFWKLLMQFAVSGGIKSTRMATSFWLRTFSQSCKACNQLDLMKMKNSRKCDFNRKPSENTWHVKSVY